MSQRRHIFLCSVSCTSGTVPPGQNVQQSQPNEGNPVLMRLQDVCVALAAGFKLYGGGSSSIVAFCLKKMCFVASVAGWAKYFPISHFLVARARPRTYCTSKTPSSHFITFQPSPGGPQAINGMCTLYCRRINKLLNFSVQFLQYKNE